MITQHPGWQLTPEMQAGLDAANARLAELAQQHAPASAVAAPPRLARDLIAWGKFSLQPAGAKLLDDHVTSADYFAKLIAHDCLADARRIMAHALPKRRALWWGVLVAWDAYRNDINLAPKDVLEAVTGFIIEPTEDRRRACGEWLKQTKKNSIAGALAAAAYFSAGSVSPPGLPPVAPRPFVTGRLIGVCVYLAAVTRSAAHYKQYLREYLKWGADIAAGRLLWPHESSDDKQRVDSPAARLEPYWHASRASAALETIS